MTKLKNTAIILCFVALLLLAAALGISTYDVARAADPYAFKLQTDDGQIWKLSDNDGEIASYTGKFIEPTNNNAVSVQVARDMKAKLKEVGRGTEDYTLTFALPVFAATSNEHTMKYTESAESADSPIFVKPNGLVSVSGGNIRGSALEYKTDAEGEYHSASASIGASGMMFGVGVDAGTYTVRARVQEAFVFGLAPDIAASSEESDEGNTSQDSENDESSSYLRSYAVERYSNTLTFTIERAPAKIPDLDVVPVTYGVKSGDMGSTFPDATGTWTLATTQTDPAFENATQKNDVYLTVSDSNYNVRMLYTPLNTNYIPAETDVKVRIEPKKLFVAIDDASSLCHEPLVPIEDLTYDIDDVKGYLVNGDTIESIGLELYIENVDAEKPGYYTIKAKAASRNYTVVSVNRRGDMWREGGRYTVFGTSQIVYAEDGMCFEVFYVTDSWKVRVELVKFREDHPSDDIIKGKSVPVKAYKFIFYDSVNAYHYPESYAVGWTKAPENALFAAHYVNNKLAFVYADASKITLSEQGVYDDTLYFYGLSLMTGYNIVLICVTSVFAVGTAICAIILILRRRRFK